MILAGSVVGEDIAKLVQVARERGMELA